MSTHKSAPARRITHSRRRAGIRTWLRAFLRGNADEDTAAIRMQEVDKKGHK